MVPQSITDAVSVLIHKHHPILKLQLVLELRLSVNLVAISHLTRVIRKNDPTCQDQNGPDKGKKKVLSHFNLLNEC
jgi:hypothetical protein